MTDLILVRHAIAHERDFEAWPDDSERPLTPQGEERCRVISSALVDIAPTPVKLLSSPYERAWQTAVILHEVAGWPEPETCPALEPGITPHETLDLLNGIAGEYDSGYSDERTSLAIVGHRPNLHELASVALTGTETMDVKIKKGGAMCVRFPGGMEPGTGQLRWLITPKTLLGARLI